MLLLCGFTEFLWLEERNKHQLEGEICAMSQVVSSLEAVGRYLETAGSFPAFAQAKESHIAFFDESIWSTHLVCDRRLGGIGALAAPSCME